MTLLLLLDSRPLEGRPWNGSKCLLNEVEQKSLLEPHRRWWMPLNEWILPMRSNPATLRSNPATLSSVLEAFREVSLRLNSVFDLVVHMTEREDSHVICHLREEGADRYFCAIPFTPTRRLRSKDFGTLLLSIRSRGLVG